MIFVASQMPHISRVERVKYGFDNCIRFKNNSKKKNQCTFENSSDKPDLLRVKKGSKTISLRGKEETDIFFEITQPGKGTRGMVRTHLFVQCAELVMHEVIAIDIEFPGK